MNAEDEILNSVMEELFDMPTEIVLENSETSVAENAECEDTEENLCQDKSKNTKIKMSELPLSKIRGIMKMDPEVTIVGSAAVFAVAKATELFLQSLAKQSFRYTSQQKKKTVQRAHVDSAVTHSESLFFLEDTFE